MNVLTPFAAQMFLVPMVPLCLFVMWDDLAHLRIRNTVVLITLGSFVAVGLWVLPWTYVAVQLAIAAAVLVFTFGLFAAGVMGGGDAKYIAAIVPFIDWKPDWALAVILFCASTVGCLVLHRVARALGAARLAPNWASWTSGKRFPLGFPLGVMMLVYLGIAALS